MRSLLTLLCVIALPRLAVADRRAAGDAESGKEKEREAREHYKSGILHFDLGEIDAAVAEFRQAYALSAAPGLLFNIAQAYRMKKDYELALQFYRTYLRLQPRAPNRVDVEARVVEMEQLQAEQQRVLHNRPQGVIPPGGSGAEERPTAEPAEEAPPRAALAPTPAPRASLAAPLPLDAERGSPRPLFRSPRGIAALSLGAVGLVGLIGAGVLGGLALSARGDYDRGCDRGVCDDSQYDRAHGMAIGTDVLIAVGVASVVVGAILVITRAKRSAPTVAGGPHFGTAGLAWGSF